MTNSKQTSPAADELLTLILLPGCGGNPRLAAMAAELSELGMLARIARNRPDLVARAGERFAAAAAADGRV
jgi:hypothetical protein